MAAIMSQHQYIDGLVQERRNSSALAMELRLTCTNPSILSQDPPLTSPLAIKLHLSCTNPSTLRQDPPPTIEAGPSSHH